MADACTCRSSSCYVHCLRGRLNGRKTVNYMYPKGQQSSHFHRPLTSQLMKSLKREHCNSCFINDEQICKKIHKRYGYGKR